MLQGVLGECSLGEYPLDFIPFDDDVLSMEYDSVLKEIYVVCISISLYLSICLYLCVYTTPIRLFFTLYIFFFTPLLVF